MLKINWTNALTKAFVNQIQRSGLYTIKNQFEKVR